MARVRAKFRLNSFSTSMGTKYEKGDDGVTRGREVEVRTLNLTPVSGGSKNPENEQFFGSTPTGSIQLGTVNPEAWAAFKLNKEYYVDFTPADEEQPQE